MDNDTSAGSTKFKHIVSGVSPRAAQRAHDQDTQKERGKRVTGSLAAVKSEKVWKVHPEAWKAAMKIAKTIIPPMLDNRTRTASLIQRISPTELVVHNSPEAANAAR